MSKIPFESLEQFLDGTMSSSQSSQLKNAAADPKVAETLVAQRTVDQLLRLAAVEEDDAFVVGCVAEFEKQLSDEVKIHPRSMAEKPPRKRAARLVAVLASAAILGTGAWWFQAGNPEPTPSVSSSLPVATKQNETPDSELKELAVEVADRVDQKAAPVPEGSPDHPQTPEVRLSDSSNLTLPPVVKELAIASDPMPKESVEVDPVISADVDSASAAPETLAPFGRIISNRSAVWSDDSDSKLINGTYRLDRGSARLSFDNGVMIRLVGPTEFELLNAQSIKVREGEMLVDIPRKMKEFSCQLGAQKLLNFRNAKFFLKVAPDNQWESFLTRGIVDLARHTEPSMAAGSEDLIELAKDDLCQVAVIPSQASSGVPSTFFARGRNRFFGQCFQGGDQVTFQSPENLQHFLTSVVGDKSIGWEQFSKSADSFKVNLASLKEPATAQQFRSLLASHLQKHFSEKVFGFGSDSSQKSTTRFRGSLNINGVERHFDSLEEFNRANRQLIEQGAQGGNPLAPIPPQVFTVGGRKIEFSTMEMFNQSRRKMNQ